MGAVKIDKENIITIVLTILLIGAGWFVFRDDLHNNSGGVDALRNDLERITDQQRRAIGRIESVEKRLDDSAAKLDEISSGIGKTENDLANVEDRLDDNANRLTSDADRIAEGQRILSDIRARSKTDGE